MIDVSVIIVNYKTSGLISNCINSIIEFTSSLDYEIIVVDNNSEKDFQQKILGGIISKSVSNIHFIALEENLGFGKANNEGLKIAKGRNILFLNPDTLILNNAIKILSDFLDSRSDAGACGGNILDENQIPSFSFRRIYPGIREYLDSLLMSVPSKILFGQNLEYNYSKKPIKVAFIVGADLMVKYKILEETGPFDSNFFMFFEEIELCRRIKKIGYKIFSVPEALIMHLESKSFENGSQTNPLRLRMREEGRKIYHKLTYTGFTHHFPDTFYLLNLRLRKIISTDKKKKNYYKQKIEIFKSLS